MEHAGHLKVDNIYNLELLIFKVEDTLFRVLKHELVQPGCFFETVLSLPTPIKDGSSAEGSTDSNPIVLQQISKRAFRNFLRGLCPMNNINRCTTYEEWRDVLDLATMWDFKVLRGMSIVYITPLLEDFPDWKRVAIAKECRVAKWLKAAYAKVLANLGIIPREELLRAGLDVETISRFYKLREKHCLSLHSQVKCSEVQKRHRNQVDSQLPLLAEAVALDTMVQKTFFAGTSGV